MANKPPERPGVVMLVNEFPPLPVGGAERQAERLAEYLAEKGWPIWVLTRRIGALLQKEHQHGVEIFRPSMIGPGKFKTISYVLGALGFLWRMRKHYEILHAHLAFGPAFAAVIAARLFGKRVIVKFGNSGPFGDVQQSLHTWRGRLRLAVLRRGADRIIALDDAMQMEALTAGFPADRIVRMNNGINANDFTPGDAHSDSKITILYVGRLTAQKSLSTILQALALALPSCPQLQLILVGQGELQAELEGETRRLNIASQVTFAGAQANVRPFLQKADLFVLPSSAEGISNALLEAMAVGLACLATPVGGNPDVLDQGRCGVLLPQGDISAWAAALVRLGNNHLERIQLGQLARERILSIYDFSVVGAAYEELYRQLCYS